MTGECSSGVSAVHGADDGCHASVQTNGEGGDLFRRGFDDPCSVVGVRQRLRQDADGRQIMEGTEAVDPLSDASQALCVCLFCRFRIFLP